MLTPIELGEILKKGFPLLDCSLFSVETASLAELLLRRRLAPHDLRPGAIVSGPTLMDLVDTAGWLHVLTRHGASAHASVTSDLSIHFLAPARSELLAVCMFEGGTRLRERYAVRHRHPSPAA